MKPMPAKPKKSSYFHQIVILLVLNLVLVGLGGLGRVWLRQQINDTAGNIQQMQDEHNRVERRLGYLDTKIAELESPAYLRRRVAQLGMDLQPPKSTQIVYMAPVWERGRRGDGEDATPAATGEPFVQSFDLAVMEPFAKSSE